MNTPALSAPKQLGFNLRCCLNDVNRFHLKRFRFHSVGLGRATKQCLLNGLSYFSVKK
jgi:hypothetical protein